MSFTTTNMSLILPSVLVDVGPTYATLIDNALVSIDSHNHSTGQGAKITPAGLNISSDLTFAQNNATNLRTLRFYPNTTISLGVNDKGCLYELNNELYYVDGAGNNVQVTSGGSVNLGTVSSLSIKDSLFVLQYFGDTSRQARFDVSNVPASTTRIYKLPTVAANDTLASLTATQTLTATTLTNGVISGSTAVTLISGSGTLTLPTSGTITVPNGTDTLVNLTGSQTITGKILTGNTIASFTPNGGTNTLTAPAITDTLVTRTNTETLTNKTLTAPVQSSYEDFTEISTPSAPSTGLVRIYSKSDNNMYYLNSSGLEQQIGSGSSSGINYISNSGFENNTTTGWSTYANTAQSTPVNGTGGSPSVTFASSSSSPLRGTYSGLFTKAAVNYQGQGISYAFTLASADVGKTLQLTFDALASANLASGDMGIYLYDVTNSVLITPSSVNVPTGTSSQYSVAMQTTTSTSYRLIFHVATTNATAYTLQLDGMSLSPVVRPMVAGESDWITYTPTFSAGFGTVTNAVGYWRRIGDTISVRGSCTTGTVAGSVASISLPTVVTSINTSKLSISANTTSNPGNNVGSFATGLANASCSIVTAPGTSTTVVYVGGLANGTAQLVPANASTIATNTTVCSFDFIVPVSNWSSNITLASTTPMIEYVSNSSTTDAADTSSFVSGASGSAGVITNTTLTTQRAKRVQFQNAIQPTDRIQIELYLATPGIWLPIVDAAILTVSSCATALPTNSNTVTLASTQGISFQGVSGSQTQLDVIFGRYAYNGDTSQAWNSANIAAGTKWRVAKYSSIGVAELAPATSTSTGTITRENIWTAYTPTISAGFGTVTNNSAFYKVLGDSLFIRGSFTTGTVAASLCSISIPSAFTISASKLSIASTTGNPGNILGQYNCDGVSIGYGCIVSATTTSTSLVYCGTNLSTGNHGSTPQNGSTILANTAVFTFTFEVPLV